MHQHLGFREGIIFKSLRHGVKDSPNTVYFLHLFMSSLRSLNKVLVFSPETDTSFVRLYLDT